jgi:hypothetical protein
MAAGDPIPPERIIYRALRNKYYDPQTNRPRDIAFLLRPAAGEFPDETYLSFGADVASAEAGLTNIRHFCEINVADILDLHLEVTEDDDPRKVRVSGMPLLTVNEERAFRVAKDLLARARMCE